VGELEFLKRGRGGRGGKETSNGDIGSDERKRKGMNGVEFWV